MIVYLIDISGRVINYDLALYKSIMANTSNDDIELLLADVPNDSGDDQVKSLIRFVPSKYKSSENVIKRLLKALEAVVNYFYILFICIFKRPDIIHFQWLPFSEICSLEIPILKMYKLFLSKSKIILTIHNVYPHNFSEEQKSRYKKRFIRLSKMFDGFIVHTKESQKEVKNNFLIDEEKISIVHHGIFEPDLTGVKDNEKKSRKYRIISYGHQDPYKGTDLLLDAIQLLPPEYKEKVELSILGRGQQSYTDLLKEKGKGLTIEWKLFFVDDKTMYQDITDADAIVLPYRNISQSGVLLLALYFNKPIICSDLPPFIETLEGYPKELFFTNGSSESLKEVIMRQIDKPIDEEILKISLNKMRSKYSWNESGKLTLEVYKKIINRVS